MLGVDLASWSRRISLRRRRSPPLPWRSDVRVGRHRRASEPPIALGLGGRSPVRPGVQVYPPVFPCCQQRVPTFPPRRTARVPRQQKTPPLRGFPMRPGRFELPVQTDHKALNLARDLPVPSYCGLNSASRPRLWTIWTRWTARLFSRCCHASISHGAGNGGRRRTASGPTAEALIRAEAASISALLRRVSRGLRLSVPRRHVDRPRLFVLNTDGQFRAEILL